MITTAIAAVLSLVLFSGARASEPPVQPRAAVPESLGIGSSEDGAWVLAGREGVEPTVPSHRVQGNVLAIDRRTGVTTIATARSEHLVLRFSPNATSHRKKGDPIMARMAFARYPVTMSVAAAATGDGSLNVERLEGESDPMTVTGTVHELDRKTGRVEVQSGGTLLRVVFDPATIRDLR